MQYQEEEEEQIIVPPRTDSLIGETLAAKYQIIDLLGRGGMSSVYKARQLLLNKTVAVKIMHQHLLRDENAMARFKQEAAAASSLSHPNIITIYDFDIAGDQPFQVIDYLEGTSLSEEIKKAGKLPVPRALHIWSQIAGAVEHAHAQGVIHRDLKPSNIMLINFHGDPDFVKIVDFGIAKLLPQEGEAVQQLTQTGEVFGSPLYMSPEQCLGKKLDSRSDIYSLGCLMFESITGNAPFMGQTVFETIQKHIEEAPRSVKDAVGDADIARHLDYILCKALAKDPSQRYQRMSELQADIDALRTGSKTSFFGKMRRIVNVAKIRGSGVQRKLPIKLLSALAAVVVLLLGISAWAVHQVTAVKIPPLHTAEIPLFTQEFDQPEEQTFLQRHGQMKELFAPAEIKILKFNTNPAEAGPRWKSVAFGLARSGMYDEATEPAAMLMSCLRFITPEQLADDPQAPDRGQLLVDFATIGDACYYATPSPEHNRLALGYFNLAEKQLGVRATNFRKRLRMKQADVLVRLNDPEDAIAMFKGSLQLEREVEFPPSVFEPSGSPDGIEDRAIFLTRIGDAATAARQWALAERAYNAAVDEWHKIPDSTTYEAQCHYLLARAQENLKNWSAAESNLAQSAELYGRGTADDKINVPPVLSELAHALSEQGKWWQSLETAQKARVEQVQLSRK